MGLLVHLPAEHAATTPAAKSAAPAVTCATCHVGVATSYTHAPMRHAMESPGSNPALESHPNLSVQMGAYTYTVQTKDGKSTYTVSDGKDLMTLPIRWMFGQHSQTWVLEKDGHLYEGLVSFFPREAVLATTPGDQKLTPHTLTEAMGRKLSTWETLECFNCHSTGATAGEKLELERLRPGLDCERCHVGSLQHMADAAHDNFTTLPKSLKKMNAEDTSSPSRTGPGTPKHAAVTFSATKNSFTSPPKKKKKNSFFFFFFFFFFLPCILLGRELHVTVVQVAIGKVEQRQVNLRSAYVSCQNHSIPLYSKTRDAVTRSRCT